MSFFKTMVVVGIAIAILPSDRENQRRLTQTAMSVSSEARSFCASRPNICISREQAWHAFVAKAGFALALGQELIWGQQINASHFDRAYDRNTQDYERTQSDGIGSFLNSSFLTN